MTRNRNRFVDGDEINAFAGWTFDDVDQASVRFAAKLRAQELAEEKLRESGARELGYAQGFEAGRMQGLQEGLQQLDAYVTGQGQEFARKLAQLLLSAGQQIDQAEQAMAEGVLELACDLARQVLRRELDVNPGALQPVLREALGLLAADSKVALVRLNPSDLEVLEPTVAQEFPGLALTLRGDTGVSPGGCVVEAAGTVVDGTLERRWSRTVARLGLESSWEVDDASR